MFCYRGEIVLWALWGVVYPTVAMIVWQVAAMDSKSGHDIRGFGPGEFAAYFLLTMIVSHVSTAWDIYEMGYQVQTGRMATKLLRPILPIWESIADNIAYKMLTLVILVPIWCILARWAQPQLAAISITQLVCGVIALLLGAILSYLWSYNLGLSAFWITRTDGLGEFWFGLSLFFGGRLAPLTILPPVIQRVAGRLPFKWMIWFPSAVLMGGITDTREILIGYLYQIGWLVFGLIVFRWLWRAGTRRFSAVGN